MKRKYNKVFIDQLLLNTKEHCIQVTCTDKTRVSNDPLKTKYTRVEFTDAKDTKIWASLFGVNVDIFNNIIKKGCVYDMSNMLVREVKPQYIKDGQTKQLYITDTTDIVLVGGEEENLKPYCLDIATLNEKYPVNKRVDIIAVVIHVNPPETINLQHQSDPMQVCGLYVTDESCETPLLISAWRDLATTLYDLLKNKGSNNCIIALSDLQSSTFGGFSLGSTMSTTVDLDPQGDRALILKKWHSKNKSVVEARKIVVDTATSVTTPTQVTSIKNARNKQASDIPIGHLLKIKGKIVEFAAHDLKLSYCCKNCGTNSDQEDDSEFVCNNCSKVSVPMPKMYLPFKVKDATGSLRLNAYNGQIETLFHVKMDELFSMTTEELLTYVQEEISRLSSTDTTMLISPVPKLLTQHNVVKWTLKLFED